MIGRVSFLLLVIVFFLAFVNVRAIEESEVPDINPASFETLEDIDSKGVETAFAEVDSQADNENEMDAENEVEGEFEAENENENENEMELDNENESELDAESELEADSEDAAFIESESARKPWHRAHNQPINRHKRNGIKNIECLDGDCVRAAKSPDVKVGSNPVAEPKKMSKLDLALAATKEEIMIRAKELHKEKDWAKKVEKLIGEYQEKFNKVTNNIDHLRKQTKALLKKKKQIQNIQVQNKLKEKLSVATSDLSRLQKQLSHIHTKENEFADTERQLKGTMGALKNSLLKLRGQNAKKAAYEGIN